MKRFTAIILLMAMLLCCAACGEKQSGGISSDNSNTTLSSKELEKEVQGKETDSGLNGSDNMVKILIAYFSATGTTKQLAEYASDILNADIYEIVPQDPYTEEDLAYYTGGRADQEQNDPYARPEISGSVENMEQYDTIVLGYPIWHGEAPKIIYTFLESYDFSGKIILPFCTSHSSGIGSSTEHLHSLAAKADWLDGERFAAGASREEIEGWLTENNLQAASASTDPQAASAGVGIFDLEKKTVLLNSGYEMPIMGLGTYALDYDTCVNSVMSLLKNGGRLIDTAYMYGNEDAVGGRGSQGNGRIRNRQRGYFRYYKNLSG